VLRRGATVFPAWVALSAKSLDHKSGLRCDGRNDGGSIGGDPRPPAMVTDCVVGTARKKGGWREVLLTTEATTRRESAKGELPDE